MPAATVRTVNVVQHLIEGFHRQSAIDKRPVDGAVEVGELGLAGDQQIYSAHGGPDRAVYVYADEDATWWADELGREIPPGLFGENLRTTGLEVSQARLGEQWRVGEVLLEVRRVRTPCDNLALHMGIDDFHLRFSASGRVGAMCRVLEPGAVTAGDPVTVEVRPDHPVTISSLASGSVTAADMQALLDSGLPLSPPVRALATRAVAKR